MKMELTIEIDDELELAEAGFRAHRQRFGAAVDNSDLTDDMKALVGAVSQTPEMALVELLGDWDGPLRSVVIPGARIVGVSGSGPTIGAETDS